MTTQTTNKSGAERREIMTKYQASYTDSNDNRSVIDLTATTLRGAKAQATRFAPAMTSISLLVDGEPVAHRESWRNPNGVYGLGKWEAV